MNEESVSTHCVPFMLQYLINDESYPVNPGTRLRNLIPCHTTLLFFDAGNRSNHQPSLLP